jgi:hypothetical protein
VAVLPAPKAGHATPQAAVTGFMQGLSQGARGACFYVAPDDLLSCAQAFTSSVSFSFSDLRIGEITERGSQALVSVLGGFCAKVNGTTTCSTNKNVEAGQPRGQSASAFDAAYDPTSALTLGKRAIPCEKVDGLWYVDLVGS